MNNPATLPSSLALSPDHVHLLESAGNSDVTAAIHADSPGTRELATLLSPAAGRRLEEMAVRARALTLRQFGRTISLYSPLYLSNYCSGGCAYCGFAADRPVPRRRLEPHQISIELAALKSQGIESVLLLTGEETAQADFTYLLAAVRQAAEQIHNVTVESFAMTSDQYRQLADAGCTGITIYQETYDPARYATLHRWGPKQDFIFRLGAPERALQAGLRVAGLGALLGLSDPIRDALALFQHAVHLRKTCWQGGVMISFPRICRQVGDFQPGTEVPDHLLAQLIFAFRIVLPDTPLVLSTRELPAFRDGMAGIGINHMSVASRTTVGGYAESRPGDTGQFDTHDNRSVAEFCLMLKGKDLFPVFKNWDRSLSTPLPS